MWQRPNHPLVMLNGLGLGVVSVFFQTKAFTALITFDIIPFSNPSPRVFIKTDSRHARIVVNLTATVNRLDPTVYQPKIAFTVIQTISIYVIYCNLSQNVSHCEVMEKLQSSTAASLSSCITM